MLAMQLELALGAPPKSPSPPLVVTRPMRQHRSCNRILERVRYVRRFFPELDGMSLKVGLTRRASGMAIMGGYEIWLHPTQVSYHTIAHEFVHLLQTPHHGVPQGERSCDVYSMARDWTLNDVAPNYVRIPRSLIAMDGTLPERSARLVFAAAVQAVRDRAGGVRNYIAAFEKGLERLVREMEV